MCVQLISVKIKDMLKYLKQPRIIAAIILIALGIVEFIYLQGNMPRLALFMILGLLIGIALERSRFCFVSAVSNLVLMKDGRLMRGVITGLMIASVGFALMMFLQVPDPDLGTIPVNAHVYPLSWTIVFGGLLFGIGSILAGGCVVGSLSRLGEGSLSVIILTAGLLVGISFYELQGEFWYDNFIVNAKQVWLPAYIGWPLTIVVTLLVLAFMYYVIRIIEASSKAQQAVKPAEKTEKKKFSWKALLGHWPVTAGGVAIGVLSILAYKIVERPIGVSGEYNRWSEVICNAIGISFPDVAAIPGACKITASATEITWGLVMNLAIILGAAIVALLSGDFKIKYPRTFKAGLRVFLGSVIMGYGVGLAGGCNIGAFFSGVISFGLNGWIFGLAVFIGSLLGIKILQITE
jgi:uncharacterized membrane protein YedE/YeeE